MTTHPEPPFPRVTAAVHGLCAAAVAYTDSATLAEAVHVHTAQLDGVELRVLVGELTARLAGCAEHHLRPRPAPAEDAE